MSASTRLSESSKLFFRDQVSGRARLQPCRQSFPKSWALASEGSSLAFHTLFFLDLYLSECDESQFRPPAPFGLSELADEAGVPEPAHTKDELLAYLEHCRKKLDAVMAGMTEAWVASPCPFDYRAMSNGELLLYNMRHVQHHAAQLNMRLRQETDSAPRWVSKGGQEIKA